MAETKAVPDGYHSVQPYLMVKNCAESMEFYGKAFGASERLRMPRPDGRIAHAEIQIGDCVLMMADEAPEIEAWSVEHFGGSPISLMFYTADCDEVYRRAVAAGASSLREPTDQPHGDRMGGVKDPFGYQWWIATHMKDVNFQEMAAQG